MPPFKVWLFALGKAIWQEVPQAIVRRLPFGEDILSISDKFHKNLREAQAPSQDVPSLQQLVNQPPEVVETASEEIAAMIAPEATPEARRNLAQTLVMAPVVSRRSLRDAADPSGVTVSKALQLERKGALVPFVPPGPPRFTEGQIFHNGWIMQQRLGTGGFAEVWKIVHPRDEDLCAAVKFFLDDKARERLGEHEVRILKQVRKLGEATGVVKLEDFDETADPPWIRFEYIAGGDLLQYARHFFGAKSTELIRQLAKAVGRCHRLNPPVVHRDLKPGNVLMVKEGDKLRPVIADFGIGGIAPTWAMQPNKPSTRATGALPTILSGSFTEGYASPQQRDGAEPDPRDDVYALGVMWYQLLSGDLSKAAPTGSAWQKKPEMQGITPAMREILGSLMEHEREDRPADGWEVAERMDAALKTPSEVVAPVVTAKKLLDPVTPSVVVAPVVPVAATNPQQVTNSIGMKFALIPAGKFMMGATKELNPNAYGDESPRHEVTLTKAFYLGIYEVTQEQWERVMKNNPSYFKGSRRPVERVSWHEAMEFCKRLSELPAEKEKGHLYRLPTEAEWEYACRGGASEFSIYHFGNTITKENANFGYNLRETTEVGKYAPNAFGLYDMHGNVWEWCLDGRREYQNRAETDPRGPAEGADRVIRGGSWDLESSYCSASYRNAYEPDPRNSSVGFRLFRVSVGE